MSKKKISYTGQMLGLFVFECVMAVVYIALSVILLFTPFFNHSMIQGGFKIGLGIILGLYGLFRVYRAYVKIKQRNE
jgi:hypothetical protein